MKCASRLAVLAVTMGSMLAIAADQEEAKLISLDKEWGAAAPGQDAVAVTRRILADDVVSISPQGFETKADLIAAAQSDDAPTGPYTADQYQVKMLSDDIAVMTHHVAEPDPHWSLHVWQMKDGEWRVVASASTPVE